MFALTLFFYWFNATRLEAWTTEYTTLGEKLFERSDSV